MYLTEVLVALVLTCLNLATGLVLNPAGVIALPAFQVLTLSALVALCGYAASRSRSLLLLLAETSFVISVVLLSYPRLTATLGLYVVGVVAGLVRVGRGFEVYLGTPRYYYSIPVSLGTSLLCSAIIDLLGLRLGSPVVDLVRGLLSGRGLPTVGLTLSATVVLVAQVYLASLCPQVVAVALASSLAPYSLPLIPALHTFGWALPSRERRYLTIGRVVEVVRGPPISRLEVPFWRGVNRNVVIVGASGTGKSTLAKELASRLADLGVATVVFDVHGEYCGELRLFKCLDAAELSLNIFKAVSEEGVRQRVDFLVDVVTDLYALGSLQRIALSKALLETYKERGEGADLNYLLELVLRASQGEVNLGVSQAVVKSLVPYVENLVYAFRSGRVRVEDLVDSEVVLDLSRLSDGVAQIVVETVLEELFALAQRSGRELVVVVDEVHRFLRRGRALQKVFREGRKYGISAVVVTQDPQSIPRDIVLNSAVVVAFALPEAATARYIAKLVAPENPRLSERIASKLMTLPQFRALVVVAERGSYVIELSFRKQRTYGV
jgi:energy-coupling factor transporter ATP-binding protein EcfA2